MCLFVICCSEGQNVLPPVDGFVVLRIDLLEEEKGAEAFFSLSITSYSYVYCVQTAEQAMLQWCSILMAAYGIAGVLGSEDGAFSAKFSILAATALIDTNCKQKQLRTFQLQRNSTAPCLRQNQNQKGASSSFHLKKFGKRRETHEKTGLDEVVLSTVSHW